MLVCAFGIANELASIFEFIISGRSVKETLEIDIAVGGLKYGKIRFQWLLMAERKAL